jgi:hypothetical protein
MVYLLLSSKVLSADESMDFAQSLADFEEHDRGLDARKNLIASQ